LIRKIQNDALSPDDVNSVSKKQVTVNGEDWDRYSTSIRLEEPRIRLRFEPSTSRTQITHVTAELTSSVENSS